MNESLDGYENRVVDHNDRKFKYEFTDDYGNDFLVVFNNDTVGPKIKPMLGNSYELTYFARDSKTGDWSIDALVSTNVYRVIQTVLGDILRDFVEERPWVSVIRLEGHAKDGEVGKSKRTKLYLRYLESNPLPDFRLEIVSTNRINLIKNKK